MLAAVPVFVFFQTKDNSSELVNCVLDLPSAGASSLHSAPYGYTDNVIYAVPHGEADFANHADLSSPPLYTNVTSADRQYHHC